MSLSLANPRFAGLSLVRCVQATGKQSTIHPQIVNERTHAHSTPVSSATTPRNSTARHRGTLSACLWDIIANSLSRNHEPVEVAGPVLAHKSLNPERTHALASTVAAKLGLLGSPADLKTNVVIAARGMIFGNGSGGFVSLVTDAHGLLCIVATYASCHAPCSRAQAVWCQDHRCLPVRHTPVVASVGPARTPVSVVGCAQYATPAWAQAWALMMCVWPHPARQRVPAGLTRK